MPQFVADGKPNALGILAGGGAGVVDHKGRHLREIFDPPVEILAKIALDQLDPLFRGNTLKVHRESGLLKSS